LATRNRLGTKAVAQAPSYQGIRFPERAERLADFGGYRVFLDHWDELSIALGERFEGVALRGESRVLAIHGEQGRGKTLFAQQLSKDFDRTTISGIEYLEG
jgi:predicted NBD/HSP70 family sugar kinase